MPPLDDQTLRTQVALLKSLRDKGILTPEQYQAELSTLGVDPQSIFDQRGQTIEKQINVAGDLYQLAPQLGASADELRKHYLHRLVQQVRNLPLTGIDPKAASDERGSELQLSSVYTALLTQQSETDEPTWQMRMPVHGEHKSRKLSALEVLNEEQRLVLLGDPGSGKTTFVNFVALCLAGEVLGHVDANLAVLTAPLPTRKRDRDEEPQPQPWKHGAILPVRIVLRDLAARGLPAPDRPASADTLWNFIVAELGETLKEYVSHFKRELMEQGGLILLDGLDEVPDADQRRAQVKQAVQGFADTFHKCCFLVTSRTYAYQRQDWKLDRFAEVVLSPFTPEQIEHFIERWYEYVGNVRGLDPADAQGKAVLLKTAIQRSERLRELAERPLLLTLMASLHAWRGGSLPENREELYADAVDLLLDQWEGQKTRRKPDGTYELVQPSLAEWLKIDRAVVRAELNRLAHEAHLHQPQLIGTADVRQGDVIDALIKVAQNPDVNPSRLIEYIRDRAGLLIARGEGVYTFPHRTFQEYLAACHLTDYGFPDEVASLARNDPNRWREATLLAGAKASRGTASAVWNLADALCYRDVPTEIGPADADQWGALLAAQALIENEGKRLGQVAERNAPKLERVRRWLSAIVEHSWLPPVDRLQAGKALAMLGDDRDFDELITIPAGPFIMGSTNEDRDARVEEKPQHRLTLSAFKIGKYPVTNMQYLRFSAATGREWHTNEGHKPEKANHPAVEITWHEALVYCAWLTEQWRAAGNITASEIVRLPTEAEWEKAVRGGPTPVADGGEREGVRTWPWGNEWELTRCNTSELNLNDTTPVGMFPEGASLYGCLDMAGNVWEWTMSLAGLWDEKRGSATLKYSYPYDASDGREELSVDDNVFRVLRGGSFLNNRRLARCACRIRFRPNSRERDFGFRVVVSRA